MGADHSAIQSVNYWGRLDGRWDVSFQETGATLTISDFLPSAYNIRYPLTRHGRRGKCLCSFVACIATGCICSWPCSPSSGGASEPWSRSALKALAPQCKLCPPSRSSPKRSGRPDTAYPSGRSAGEAGSAGCRLRRHPRAPGLSDGPYSRRPALTGH